VAPGTTEGIVREVLERESGLTVGSDFSLAFSPERIDPGNPAFDLVNTPKIVGGITSRCTEAASTFYEQFVTTIHPASRAREAESAKILENLYRNVNIALVNEFAIACHALGIDVHEAIDLAATKPFGFTAFRPGAGVGGHCIPIDPQYFDFLVRERTGLPMRFIEVANQVNEGMSNYVGRLAQDALNELGRPLRGSTVLLLGVAYKPDIDDTRETPAAPISRWLADHGARVVFHDPHVAFWDNSALAERTSQPDLESSMSDADLNVALQAHRHYRSTTLSADVAGKTLAIAYPVFPEARFRL
jgi:nucleotide sugar dehydrogenase